MERVRVQDASGTRYGTPFKRVGDALVTRPGNQNPDGAKVTYSGDKALHVYACVPCEPSLNNYRQFGTLLSFLRQAQV